MVAGSGLCFAMGISIFSTKASEVAAMLIKLLQRCYDRRGSLKIHKKNEFGEEDDQPNTK
jgi:hypothetical protein